MATTTARSVALATAMTCLVACGDSTTESDAGTPGMDAARADAEVVTDGGDRRDAGPLECADIGDSCTGREDCCFGLLCAEGRCLCFPAGDTSPCGTTLPDGSFAHAFCCSRTSTPVPANPSDCTCALSQLGDRCMSSADCEIGTCIDGRCAVSEACPDGHADCNGDPTDGCETDTNSDVNHCGSCATACPVVPFETAACADGTCGFECDAGFHACAGGCVSDTDVGHCGTACAPCASTPNGTATCDGTACGIVCDPGFHPCGATCVEDLDVAHCGSSCSPCAAPPPNATATCDGVSCGFTCLAGFHLCGGACVPNTSVATCGTACSACPSMPNATAMCNGISCGHTCNPGFHDCGGACVSNADVGSCGSSCSPCPPAPANATATCDGTSCGFVCDAGYHLCGGECVPNASVMSCGSSCSACSVPSNGSATCDGVACGISCGAGYHACGSTCASDTSPSSCGSMCTPCATPMNGTATCTSGACGAACDPSFIACGGGCGCGASCTSCPPRPNATTMCAADGTCAYTCNVGFGDCDGNPANGCETSARTAGNTIAFCDSFETGTANWTTAPYWSRATCTSCSGSYMLRGTAGSAVPSSCDVVGNASMVVDVDLSSFTSAALYFSSYATTGEYDTMVVYASTNAGASWNYLATAPRFASWSSVAVNLAAYVGQPAVRLRFEFTNVCGDIRGVTWNIDNVIIEGR